MLLSLLCLVVLVEGVALVNARHVLGEACGSRFIAATFALLLEKIVQVPAGAATVSPRAHEADMSAALDVDGPAVEYDREMADTTGGDGGSTDGGMYSISARYWDEEGGDSGAMDSDRPATVTGQRKEAGAAEVTNAKTKAPEDQADEANMFGGDVMRRFWDFFIAAFIPISISAMIGGITVLFAVLGVAALPGVAVMGILLVVNARLGQWAGKIEHSNLKIADKRVGLLSEIVNSIKAVKFFAWEDA